MRIALPLFSAIFFTVVFFQPFAQRTPLNPRPGTVINDSGTLPPAVKGGLGLSVADTAKAAPEKKVDYALYYGPKTTKFFTEESVKDTFQNISRPDSSLHNIQRWDIAGQSGFRMLDLGAQGSPSKPLFFETPERLGNRLGLGFFSPYRAKPENVKYVDTRSPFTSWSFVQGGEGRTRVLVDFSRNVTKTSNFGLSYRSYGALMLKGANRLNSSDRSGMQSIYMHGNYISPNKKYRFLGFADFFAHNYKETGGLNYGLYSKLTDLYLAGQIGQVNRLNAVKTTFGGSTLHTYQQYALVDTSSVVAFHVLNIENEKSIFNDQSISINKFSYVGHDIPFVVPADSLYQSQRFRMIENKAGVRGKYKGFNLSGYVANRSYTYHYTYDGRYNIPQKIKSDQVIGGEASFRYKRYGIKFVYQSVDVKDSKFFVEAVSPFFEAGLERVTYRPSVTEQHYMSSLYRWDNVFSNTAANTFRTALKVGFKGYFTAKVFASNSLIQNIIYFDTTAHPVQSDKLLNILSAGTRFTGRLGKFGTENEFVFTYVSDKEIFRAPTFFALSQWYFESQLFKKAILARIGLDMQWKSAFYADAYSSATHVFHLQNERKVEQYLNADAYLSGQIKRVLLFVKMSNISQNLLSPGGFSAFPYMAQGRGIAFGVRWLLFD